MAILVFDSFEDFVDAYRTPGGEKLRKDEAATIANPRVYRIDATVQL
jgi:hypothetical protein